MVKGDRLSSKLGGGSEQADQVTGEDVEGMKM